MKDKVDDVLEMFDNESQLLHWMEVKALEMKKAKAAYIDGVTMTANKRIYAGVSVRLNNRVWRSEREYGRSKVCYDDHQWVYEPLV